MAQCTYEHAAGSEIVSPRPGRCIATVPFTAPWAGTDSTTANVARHAGARRGRRQQARCPAQRRTPRCDRVRGRAASGHRELRVRAPSHALGVEPRFDLPSGRQRAPAQSVIVAAAAVVGSSVLSCGLHQCFSSAVRQIFAARRRTGKWRCTARAGAGLGSPACSPLSAASRRQCSPAGRSLSR